MQNGDTPIWSSVDEMLLIIHIKRDIIRLKINTRLAYW